jgi:hypothetical protein
MKNARNLCKCGHTRGLHDEMGCLSSKCWSPLKTPESRRCKRFRAAKGKKP